MALLWFNPYIFDNAVTGTVTNYTSLSIPTTPIFSLNALNAPQTTTTTFTNGNTVTIDGRLWTAVNTNTLNVSGSRKYFTTSANGSYMSGAAVTSAAYGTNGGGTCISIARMTNWPAANTRNIQLSLYFEWYYYSGGWNDYHSFWRSQAGYAINSGYDPVGTFSLFVARQQGTSTNAQIHTSTTFNRSTATGTVNNALTNVNSSQLPMVGSVANTSTAPTFDLLYSGHWDRYVSDTEITNLYNSAVGLGLLG